MFNNKTIILAVHEYANFSATIKKGLEHLGFKVVELDMHQPPFKYKNVKERLHNFIRKAFFHDQNYKQQIKQKAIEEKLLVQLEHYTHFDYALLIRADILPKSVINSIREKTDLVAAYQWDGLNRFPNIYDYIPLVDRFFVFDSNDLSVEKTLPATNFYFKHLKVKENNPKETRASFIGSYFEHRNPILKNISQRLSDLGVKTDISIFSNHENEIQKIQHLGFRHIDTTISYEDNLRITISSEIVIDVHINEHNGLSFRIFEALGYDKKVITTNSNVKSYDFYAPENILVWNGQNAQELEKFITTPYKPLDQTIKHKYSFYNWTKYILDIGEYTTIKLPVIKDQI